MKNTISLIITREGSYKATEIWGKPRRNIYNENSAFILEVAEHSIQKAAS